MGTLRFQGEIIRKKTAIGYAPEDYVMPYYMSVRDFLESIGKIRDVESKRLKQEIDDHLNFFDMKSYEHRSFGALSNGMRQKVNLIQAFLNRPKTILLDEPLHGLDEESQKKVLKLVKSRLKDCLIIVSTHYPEHFKTRNKRVYQMIDGRLFIEQA
jgi:ABC-2 type transport system ATP-binding protein